MPARKKKTISAPPPEELMESLEWSLEPEERDWSSAVVHAWMTLDEKYQVLRIDSMGLGHVVFGAEFRSGWGWDKFENDHKLGPGYPKYYKSLEEALVSVEVFHLRRTGKDTVKTNMEDVLSHAHKLGLDGARHVRTTSTQEGGEERPKPVRKREGKMSGIDAAYQLLLEEDRPMDLKEMIKLMSERGYWTSPSGATPDRTIGAAVGVSIRKGDPRFKKVGRGLFAANK